jgi:hypothetical protein
MPKNARTTPGEMPPLVCHTGTAGPTAAGLSGMKRERGVVRRSVRYLFALPEVVNGADYTLRGFRAVSPSVVRSQTLGPSAYRKCAVVRGASIPLKQAISGHAAQMKTATRRSRISSSND